MEAKEEEPLVKPFCVKHLIFLINDAERTSLRGVAKKQYVIDQLKYINLDVHGNQLKDWKVIRPLLSDIIDVLIACGNSLDVNVYDKGCCEIV